MDELETAWTEAATKWAEERGTDFTVQFIEGHEGWVEEEKLWGTYEDSYPGDGECHDGYGTVTFKDATYGITACGWDGPWEITEVDEIKDR
jgi:hypothetical protein